MEPTKIQEKDKIDNCTTNLLEDDSVTSISKNTEKCTKKSKIKEDLDYIFDEIVGGGDGGDLGQWVILFALFPVGLCAGFPLFMHLFACFEPRHRCYIPTCDDFNNSITLEPEWMSLAIPTNDSNFNDGDNCQAEMLKEDELFDKCHRYEPIQNQTTCELQSFNHSNIVACESFVYDTSVVIESFTTKFDLVCEMQYKQMILGVMVMSGLTIGSEIGGRLGDKYGRKIVMLVATLVIVPTVMFSGYSNDFWTYAILKLICICALPCIWFNSHNLVIEIFSKDRRKNAVVIKEILWPIGGLGLVIVFYLTRHWTYFHLWTGGLCAFALPAFLIIPESPRWLSANIKSEMAERELLKIARWNRRNLSNNQKEKISIILRKLENDVNVDQEKKLGLKDMMDSNNFWKTMIIMSNWIITCVTCFTLALNVTRLSGNVFLNSALLAILGDLPGKMLVGITLKFFSRRLNLFACQFLVGLFCVIVAFLPKTFNLPLISFYLLAMCFSNASFTLCYLITGELYPTNLRSQAIGSCSTISRVFGISAPFISKLACIWKPLPMLVLGIPSICISFLAYFLPETKYLNLPQTMNDTEKLKERHI